MLTSAKKVIVVHGYEASSKDDWFPLVADELEKSGVDFSIPDMPGGSYPVSTEWIAILNTEVQASSKPVVLIGFSIGAQAVLLYLEKYAPATIDTVILIAAFHNKPEQHTMEGNKQYNTFFDHVIDMQKVKSTKAAFILMHSKDDPHAKYEWGKELAQDLDAKLITYEDRDHFYQPENASYILDVIKQTL